MKKFIDLTGQKFNKLLVIGLEKYIKKGKSTWLCKCDCGNKIITQGGNLKNNNTKSCGCLKKENGYKIGKSNIKHGLYRIPTYNSWISINQRCSNFNANNYKDYGGRGIAVCSRWTNKRDGFINFLEDMGRCPPGGSIDRINNNGNYCPENCKWSTTKEQSRNRRSSVILEHNNKKQCLQDWSIESGIKAETIQCRLKRGWSIEKALTTPAQKRRTR